MPTYRIKPIAIALATAAVLIGTARADDPPGGRLGRLFRFGGSSAAPSNPHDHDHDKPASSLSAARPAMVDASRSTYPATPYPATPYPATPAASVPPPSTPDFGANAPGPRIAPQPRVSKPPTEADPIVTRVAIGRSDNGSQFGMFLQVFADGTVMDSEGVHRVGPDAMKPLMDALRMTEIYRLKGHCGAPSTDFIEQAHIVVFERSYGKLKATSFSYSGNPQGCDPSVKHLHAALDGIQAKLSGSPAPAASVTTAHVDAAPPIPSPTTPAARLGTPVLGLTAPNP